MKKYTLFFMIFLVTLGIVTLSSCSNTPKEKEFWEVDPDFVVPVDWESHSYADAFSIMIPPYMNENLYEIGAVDSSNVNQRFIQQPFYNITMHADRSSFEYLRKCIYILQCKKGQFAV